VELLHRRPLGVSPRMPTAVRELLDEATIRLFESALALEQQLEASYAA
jgi:hypothetical protein